MLVTTCVLRAQKSLGHNDPLFLKYQQIQQLKDDSLRCLKLLHYAKRISDSLRDYDLALLIFEKVDAILKQKHYPTIRLDLTWKWAYTYYQKGDFEAADALFVKALADPLIQTDLPLKADILNKAGVNLQDLSTFKRSMVYYNEAIEIYTKLGDEKGKAMVYVNMANVFALTGNLDKSDQFFDKAAEYYQKNNEPDKCSIILANKGVIKWKAGNRKEAKQLLVRSLYQGKQKIKDLDHFITSRFNVGLIYSELKLWDSCFYYLKRGKQIADSLELSDRYDGTYYYDLGYCFVEKGDIKKGVECYKQALKLRTGIADYRSLYDNIAELYVQLKQYDTAFLYKDRSQKLTDSIYKSELTEHIAFENKRLELLEKDYQNQIKATEQEKELNNLTKRNYLLLGLIALLLIVGLLFFLYFKQDRLRKRKEHLQSELDFLKAQLNPHFLFNSINNIYVLLDENKDKASEILLKFSDLMRYQLYECNVPTILLRKELNFLVNYIEFEKLRYMNKIRVNHNLSDFSSGDLSIAPLLLQPFIENAFKHSPKSKSSQSLIEIRVSLQENNFLFEVSNTRDEQELSELPGGIGLENVKKRLKLLYSGKHQLDINISSNVYSIILKLNLVHD